MSGEASADPEGVREAVARARARRACARGWDGKDGSRSTNVSRTRPPARRLWSLASRFGAFGSAEAWASDERALSASARPSSVGAGRGEAAARMPGGAPMFAPETGRRRTPRHRLARAGSAPRQPRPAQAPAEATAAIAADPCGSAPRADAAPLSNASGSAPSRTGWANTRMKFHSCQGIYSRARTPLTGGAASFRLGVALLSRFFLCGFVRRGA